MRAERRENTIAIPTGWSMPPPTPWITRAPTRAPRDGAIAQSTDAPVKMAMAESSTRFAPNRSAIHPEAGIHTAKLSRYPVAIH